MPPPPVTLQRANHDDPRVVAAVRRYVGELDARFPGGFAVTEADLVDPGGHYLLALRPGTDPGTDGPDDPDDADGAVDVVGVGGVRALPSTDGVPTAEVKRMWVDPSARGSGLGRLLLGALEDLARELGHRRVLLDTHLTLGEALALYDRAGYDRVERYNDNPYAQAFFAKRLD
ncbi:MAG: GNAT family N-acetyltransferase [Nocardioides marinisabuli]|uniref:GNAT family N-acetyltransferase n=1 Tax=Nocardioides marinisabuli TaxID=419476 RepID=UPI00321906A8